MLGRFLLGCNSTYAAGSTGGEATHTLSWDEMPKHVHPYQTTQDTGSTSEFGLIFDTGQGRWTAYANRSKNTGESGSSKAHNNMPPYLSVHIWKRIN